MYFLLCPRQGLKIEDGVLHRVYILGPFCPKQGQGLKPSAAPLYPTIGQVPPPPGHCGQCAFLNSSVKIIGKEQVYVRRISAGSCRQTLIHRQCLGSLFLWIGDVCTQARFRELFEQRNLILVYSIQEPLLYFKNRQDKLCKGSIFI